MRLITDFEMFLVRTMTAKENVLSLVLCTAAGDSKGVAQSDKEWYRKKASGFLYRRKLHFPNHNNDTAWEIYQFVIFYFEGLLIRHDKRH